MSPFMYMFLITILPFPLLALVVVAERWARANQPTRLP